MKPSSGPHATNIGNFEFRIRPTTERKDCGHCSGAPSGDVDQSCVRISAPTSPPPDRKTGTLDSFIPHSTSGDSSQQGAGAMAIYEARNSRSNCSSLFEHWTESTQLGDERYCSDDPIQ